MTATDVMTGKAVVLMQDVPLVPLRPWIADVLRVSGETRRALQIVTPITSRLSWPLRQALTGPNSRWVVRDGSSYYDGLNGASLSWDGGMFVQASEVHAPAYVAPPAGPAGVQLTLTYQVRHEASADFCATVEQLSRSLTGTAPHGWGRSEPISMPWDRTKITEFCRSRPAPFTVVAPGLIGSVQITPVPGGFLEAVTLLTGYPDPAKTPVASLPAIIGGVPGIGMLVAQFGPGRADLTVEPRAAGAAVPLGVAVAGPQSVQGFTAQPLGNVTWFPLGDLPPATAWMRYRFLLRTFQQPRT